MDEDAYTKRLSSAHERMVGALKVPLLSSLVNVGDTIPVDHEAGFLRGHGTELVQLPDGPVLMATVCGLIERVNKLVSVRPFSPRYGAQTGDVVVGRITEVAMKRWKVNIGSAHDAHLMLSAVNLPGGIQRRRNAVDELNMRTLYTNGDLISAEVQNTQGDGSAVLHTRSLKYGKLEGGQLVIVYPYLIKRMKQHFHLLPTCNVNIIIGCNGYVWIYPNDDRNSKPIKAIDDDDDDDDGGGGDDGNDDDDDDSMLANEKGNGVQSGLFQSSLYQEPKVGTGVVALELRERICRVAMSVRVLGNLGLSIFPDSIVEVYKLSLDWKIPIKDMNGPEFRARILEREVDAREKKSIS